MEITSANANIPGTSNQETKTIEKNIIGYNQVRFAPERDDSKSRKKKKSSKGSYSSLNFNPG